MRNHRFAIATREELWSRGVLVESRLSHGEAVMRDGTIDARDARDDELVAACDARLESLRGAPDVRLVVSARRVEGMVLVSATSIVKDEPFIVHRSSFIAPSILWLHGTASVLLHEAAGHAAEHGAAPVAWPAWLRVTDEPDFALDDVGEPTGVADLLREPPRAYRRESFRDVPLRRMSKVVVRAENAPFAVPARRVEVTKVEGGHYEPLTDVVSLFVTGATLVDGDARSPLAPFVLSESRERIARALAGASGEPEQWRDVVCSREGQEVVVGSFAPLVLTTFA